MKKERRTITTERTIFIAEDGKEFTTEKECKAYEVLLQKQKTKKELIAAAEKLRIPDLDEIVPLNTDANCSENNTFRWYRLNSIEDFNVFEAIYPYYLSPPMEYPTIMCIENCSQEPYEDDGFSTTLEAIKHMTISFWDRLGYEVSLRKVKEI